MINDVCIVNMKIILLCESRYGRGAIARVGFACCYVLATPPEFIIIPVEDFYGEQFFLHRPGSTLPGSFFYAVEGVVHAYRGQFAASKVEWLYLVGVM